MMANRLAFILALLLFAGHSTLAATLPAGFVEIEVASGLAAPTAMAFAPDGRLFVTLQGGDLRVIKNGALLAAPFSTVAVDATGERGLLGVAFDPNFASNHFVYIYYTVPSTPRHNRVSRFTANGDVALAGSEIVLVELESLSGATNHNGGAIHFGADGKLYIAVGENANPANAQTLANRLGKILRINADGTIPPDNPFFGSASGANRAIWALGLRNPFTFAFQSGGGRMFINDVGASSFEEINDGLAGANYGWPVTEGPTTDPRFRSPVFFYVTGSGPTDGCAISGGAFYNPPVNQFPAEFTGKYFFADFCGGWIRQLDSANPGAAPFFATGISFPVDLQIGPDGALYYLARGGGQVFQVLSTANLPPALQFSAATYRVAENAGSAVITVSRNGPATGVATVDFRSSDGSAVAGSDYTAASGTLTFADGESGSKTFAVAITNDATSEPDETVLLTLSNATGAALGSPNSATLAITSDEAANPAGDGGGCVIRRGDDHDSSLLAWLSLALLWFGARRERKKISVIAGQRHKPHG